MTSTQLRAETLTETFYCCYSQKRGLWGRGLGLCYCLLGNNLVECVLEECVCEINCNRLILGLYCVFATDNASTPWMAFTYNTMYYRSQYYVLQAAC